MAENTFVLKMGEDSDVMQSLEKLSRENSIEYGLLISASGKIKDVELISTEPNEGISKKKFREVHEVNAVSGKIERARDGKMTSNIRVSLTSSGFTSRAGQLVGGRAAGTLEIGVRKVDLKKIIES